MIADLTKNTWLNICQFVHVYIITNFKMYEIYQLYNIFFLLMYQKAHSGELTLNGVLNGKKVSYKVGINSKGFSSTNLPLHRVAAKYLIKDLECDDEGTFSWFSNLNSVS